MKKITLVNKDTGEVIKRFETRKRSDSAIQDEIINAIKETIGGMFFVEGVLHTFDFMSSAQFPNGTVWWATKVGNIQYTIE